MHFLRYRLLATPLLLTVCTYAATLSDNLAARTEYTELVNTSSSIAAGFRTDSSSYRLDEVTVLLQANTPGTLTLGLYSSAPQSPSNELGFQPGSLLGSLTSPGSYPSLLAPVSFGGNNLQLSPGSTYWLVMSGSAGGNYEWSYAGDNTGTGSGFYPSWGVSTDGGQSWYTSDLQPMQMRVSANAVAAAPEPGVTSMLLLGMALVGVRCRKVYSR